MNFLMLRSSQAAAQGQPSGQELYVEANNVPKPAVTLEGLSVDDPFPQYSTATDFNIESDIYDSKNGHITSSSAKDKSKSNQDHIEVKQDEGWITIPQSELPENWNDAPDILSFRSLDRCFVFPGEQVHILACLSAYKQDTEIITPFKVAAVMSKNGIGQSTKKQNGKAENETNPVSGIVEVCHEGEERDQNGENYMKGKIDSLKDVSSSESLLRMENHRRQTEKLLRRFKNSHFFVRIAESDEPLWSKRKTFEESQQLHDMLGEACTADPETRKTVKYKAPLNAAVNHGGFDAHCSGGMARNAVKCCSLPNGDIVVLLQVNIGADFIRNPVLEILQFEKYEDRDLTSQNQEELVYPNQDSSSELLKWLLPLDNSIPQPIRPLSPPPITSSSSIRSSSIKPTLSGSSGSQFFSFGHFRSYSMSSLPPTTMPPPQVTTANSRSSIDLEEWNQFSFHKSVKSENSWSEKLLSFRGVQLEPERFSVRCGLEGIYVPGRRWRKKIEIIQPVEIHSFVADCNTDDLLCVQIKNVSPAHIPDIVVYVDAISVIFEKVSKVGPPQSLPIACIESGNDHALPNLSLRRGEEHSFILKPITSMRKNPSDHSEASSQSSLLQAKSAISSLHPSSNPERKNVVSSADQYAVLVSCRCNYTESKLFFKQPTSWQPRVLRDLMITVASEMSGQTLGSDGVSELPVQVLTLHASNLTSEDLTLTVLAPASFTSLPSLVSLNSSPSSPLSMFVDSDELRRLNADGQGTAVQNLLEFEDKKQDGDLGCQSFNHPATSISDILPNCDLGCTHLWLQSRVPLGCVPSQSMATIKLELLPLTDGIITLDSLQIDVKEKGLAYVPEHSLKINVTSSITTGII